MKVERTKKAVAALLVVLVACGSAHAVDSNVPIGHWEFDEGSGTTAYDSAGAHDGTVYGAAWTTGRIGGALDFDGDDGVYLEPSAGAGSPLNIYNTDLTISCWAKRRATGGTIVARTKPWYHAYVLAVATDRAFIDTYKDGPGHWTLYTDEILSEDTWYHIAGVFDRAGDMGRVYVDAIEEANGIMVTDPVSNNAATKIGCRHNTSDFPFDGIIDDVRIYDVALSPSEIEQLYQEGAAPVAHWEFDEGTGSIAYDSAGDNDGNVYGAEWTTGILDGALDFDGLGDYVEITDSPELRFNGVEPFSVSVWFNRLADTGEREILLEKGFNGDPENTNYALYIRESDDTVRWFWEHGSGTDDDLSSGVTAELGRWYHAVGVWDGNSQTICVNGVEENGVTPVGMPDSSWNRPVVIGRVTGGSGPTGQYFNGIIDDARVYNRALSAEEIEQLYEEGVGLGPEPAAVFYVDGVNGSDSYDGLTLETAFATIQKGIDTAQDGNTVLVYPAVYVEAVDFMGNATKVQGIATAAGAPIIEAPGDYAVSFFTWEEANSVITNFIIRNSYDAVFIAAASPTISNLTVVDNKFGIAAYAGAEPNISNCIFYDNNDGDLFQCEAHHSWTQEGTGPIDDSNLAAYWKFDEGSGMTAYDSAGDNDGTIYGATWTTGRIGGALNFDGLGDYVNIGQPESLKDMGSASIVLWFEPDFAIDDTLNTYLALFEKNRDGGPYNGDTFVDFTPQSGHEGRLQLDITNDTGDQFVVRSDSSLWPAGIWQHAAVTWTNATGAVRMFINGVEQADIVDDFTGVTMSAVRDVTIGSNSEKTMHWWEGIIDDVRIYDRALSAEEVQQVYEYGLGPLFADANAGDYHLKSERGRYWPEHDVWVLDDVTSPCVDGGDPNVNPGGEPMPNGGRVNMGAYGNTAYASMSEWPIPEDNNRDGLVNWIDFAMLADKWLQQLGWVE